MSDLNAFVTWADENPNRCVTIHINEMGHGKGTRVFVYDRAMREGQLVSSVEEIDLEGKMREAELAELERLKAKYAS